MTYIGVDVSKLTIDCAWFFEGRWHHHRYANSLKGFKQALSAAPDGSHWVMEATGTYHQRLSYFLHEQQCRLSVVNPLSIKRYGQMKLRRAKTDKADAKLIAEYGMSEAPKVWRPTSPEIAKLKQLEHWRQELMTTHTRLTNQLEAMNHSVYCSESVVDLLHEQLTLCEQQIKACEQELQQSVQKLEGELYQRLLTIPGIGPKTACHLIILTDGFRRFDTVKQLIAYVGLASRAHSSGTSIAGSRAIVKSGTNVLRKLLYLCSWTASKTNPGCRQLSERLLAKGKPGKLVCVAVASKLLRQAFAVAKSQRSFDTELCMG